MTLFLPGFVLLVLGVGSSLIEVSEPEILDFLLSDFFLRLDGVILP